MITINKTLNLETHGKGLYEFTSELRDFFKSGNLRNGQISAFCRHTSCSLVIMENADPSVQVDLEYYINNYKG